MIREEISVWKKENLGVAEYFISARSICDSSGIVDKSQGHQAQPWYQSPESGDGPFVSCTVRKNMSKLLKDCILKLS